MEKENLQLQDEIQENVRNQEMADEQIEELLDILDDVCHFLFPLAVRLNLCQVYEKWRKLPWDEMETWSVQTIENTKPIQPP
jgi:kinetochore protein NNF1